MPLNDAIDRDTVEVFRSKDILARKEREAQDRGRNRARRRGAASATPPPGRTRSGSCEAACLDGRSTSAATTAAPASGTTDVGKAASAILGGPARRLHAVREAPPSRRPQGARALLTAADLRASRLSSRRCVCSATRAARPSSNRPRPLREVFARIEHDTDYGQKAKASHSPSGSARTLRLGLRGHPAAGRSLLRADKIQVTSKGTDIDSATGAAADALSQQQPDFRQPRSPEEGPRVRRHREGC